jgi:hypothetical protein
MIMRFLQLIFFCGMFLLMLSTKASAETPFPKYHEPEGEGVKCVQPEDEIRKNHMNYILHQRDETVHEGIRTETYSLAKCIDCHVQPDENGNIVGHDSEEHFCNACHQYSAVQIDCFECHADRPQKYIRRDGAKQASNQQLHDALAAKADDGSNK